MLISGDHYGGRLEKDSLEVENVDNYVFRLPDFKKIFKKVRERLKAAHNKSTHTYNLRKRNNEFFVCDKVWKKNYVVSAASRDIARKFVPRFVLCRVKKKLSKLV